MVLGSCLPALLWRGCGVWALLFAGVVAPLRAALAHPAGKTAVRFGNGSDSARLCLRLAQSAEEHARGLMRVAALKPNGGMLFVFADAQTRTFWMKDTYLPLDLIFVGADCRVVGCKTHAVPHDETPLGVTAASQYVVELAAGGVAKHRIQTGDRVTFSVAGHSCPRPQPSPAPVLLPPPKPR